MSNKETGGIGNIIVAAAMNFNIQPKNIVTQHMATLARCVFYLKLAKTQTAANWKMCSSLAYK
jgi:hypothetical protein